jgi:hypothetical protein
MGLTDFLVLDTAEANGLFLGVIADDLHNREAISRDQVGISRVPNGTGCGEELYKPIPIPCSCEP